MFKVATLVTTEPTIASWHYWIEPAVMEWLREIDAGSLKYDAEFRILHGYHLENNPPVSFSMKDDGANNARKVISERYIHGMSPPVVFPTYMQYMSAGGGFPHCIHHKYNLQRHQGLIELGLPTPCKINGILPMPTDPIKSLVIDFVKKQCGIIIRMFLPSIFNNYSCYCGLLDNNYHTMELYHVIFMGHDAWVFSASNGLAVFCEHIFIKNNGPLHPNVCMLSYSSEAKYLPMLPKIVYYDKTYGKTACGTSLGIMSMDDMFYFYYERCAGTHPNTYKPRNITNKKIPLEVIDISSNIETQSVQVQLFDTIIAKCLIGRFYRQYVGYKIRDIVKTINKLESKRITDTIMDYILILSEIAVWKQQQDGMFLLSH